MERRKSSYKNYQRLKINFLFSLLKTKSMMNLRDYPEMSLLLILNQENLLQKKDKSNNYII